MWPGLGCVGTRLEPNAAASATILFNSPARSLRTRMHDEPTSSSAVAVPNVRTCCSRALVCPGPRTHATTVFLWTSNPPQRSLTRSMASPPRCCAGARRSVLFTTLLGVLDGNNAGSRKLPRQFRPGLVIPNAIDVSGRRRPGIVAHFHCAGCATGPSPFRRRTVWARAVDRVDYDVRVRAASMQARGAGRAKAHEREIRSWDERWTGSASWT